MSHFPDANQLLQNHTQEHNCKYTYVLVVPSYIYNKSKKQFSAEFMRLTRLFHKCLIQHTCYIISVLF
jgi:hypothetical protein